MQVSSISTRNSETNSSEKFTRKPHSRENKNRRSYHRSGKQLPASQAKYHSMLSHQDSGKPQRTQEAGGFESSNNRIDYVTMDNFKGMKKLKSIDLNYNQIKHVLTVDESITLPKLEQLMLSNNQLYELDVCGWLMPSLGSAYLRSNELTYVIGLSTNNFRAIKHLDLGNNPLNCRWKEGFEKYAEDRNLFLSNHVDCDYSHEDTVPSSCKFTAAMNSKFKAWWNAIEAKSGAIVGDVSNRFSNGGGKLSTITDQLEGHIEAKVRNLNEELNRKLVMMEKKFIKQMAEQRNMIDDLVEVIYRMEIERVYNKTQNRG
nr:uncharacterized protein LOC109400085 [Aedes albopictus]